MSKLIHTKEFLSDGAIIFGSKKGFLAKAVAGLGLAAMVSIVPLKAEAKEKIEQTNLETITEEAKPVIKGFFRKVQEMKSGMSSDIESVGDIAAADLSDVMNSTVDYLEFMAKKVSLNLSVHQVGEYQVPHYVASEFIRAAKDFDFDVPTLFAISEKESSFKFNAEAKTSTATGWFQPLEQTWLESIKLRGNELGLQSEADLIEWNGRQYTLTDKSDKERILGLRNDPYTAAAMTILKLKEDKARISNRIGRDLSNEEIYLPHFLGTSGAAKLLANSDLKPNVTAASLFPSAARANKNMFRAGGKQLSARQFHERAMSIIGERSPKYENIEYIVASSEASVMTALLYNDQAQEKRFGR